MRQVITFTPEGTVQGLQRKPGQGIDLTKLGPAKVVRVSEIEWDEDAQAWTIRLLATNTIHDGDQVTYRMWEYHCGDEPPAGAHPDAGVKDQPIRFDDYDTAVKAEIALLDAWRLRGGL